MNNPQSNHSFVPNDFDPIPCRFSLRSIFIITTVLAVLLGIFRAGPEEFYWPILFWPALIASALFFMQSVNKNRTANASIAASISLILGLLIFTYEPQRMRVETPPPPCLDNMKHLMLAIKAYGFRHRAIPPAFTTNANGKPMHSWRVQILQELGYDNIFRQYRFSEPWNSPHNSKITAEGPEIFHCPSDKTAGATDTSYVAVLSPKSTWGINQSKSIDAIKDGADNTILLIEMKNSGIHWAEPRDLDLSDLPPAIDKQKLFQSLSNHNGGVFVAYASGRIEFLPFEHSSLEYLEALVSRNGGETIEWKNDMPQVVYKKSGNQTSP